MSQPIIVIVSEDSFLVSRELERLLGKLVDPATADFNFNRYVGKEDSIGTILDACSMMPMMGERRVVLVRDADQFKKESLETLLSYFDNPSPTTVLILVATKIDKRLKAWQRATKAGWVKELAPPFPNQLPGWIQTEAKRMGLSISPAASQALAESVGNVLAALVSSLEKLELYITPRKNIEVDDVVAAIGDFLSKTVFDFTESVAERKLGKAEHLLDQMMVKGEPLVRLLFMVIRHFRLLLLAHEGLQSRLDEREMAKALGVHPFFVKDYIRQAQKISRPQLHRIYDRLLQADRSLKRGSLQPRHVVDRFLMEACNPSVLN